MYSGLVWIVAKGKHGASLQLAGEEAKLELLYELPTVFDETAEDTAALSRPKLVTCCLQELMPRMVRFELKGVLSRGLQPTAVSPQLDCAESQASS